MSEGHQHSRHAGRDDLTGEHRLGDALQLVFLFVFLGIWILDSFVFRLTTFLSEAVPAWVRWTSGSVILLFSLYLSRGGLRIVFGEERSTPGVITKGVFSIVRHPIYLGALLFYAGMIAFTLSIASAVFWLFIILFYRFISRYEERLLTERFGDEYRSYMKKVPMLFPLKIRIRG